MRKSTSPFSMWKPSKATRRLLFATSSLSSLLAVILGSCRVHDDEDLAVVKPSAAEVATDMSLPHGSEIAHDAAPSTPATCTADKLIKLPWRANLQTAAGVFPVQMDLSAVQTLQVISARIGDETLQLPVRGLMGSDDLTSLCSKIPADKMHADYVEILGSSAFSRSLMTRLLPNCDFHESLTDTWDCRWQSRTVAASGEELVRIERQILTRWSRQPYALVRRLSTARFLQHALGSKDSATKLNSFCKVASQSLPIELPLIVRSEAWQKQVCQENASHRDDVARIGLSMAVDEVVALTDSYQNQSHQGVISVQLPTNDARRHDYWISLQQMVMPNATASVAAAIPEASPQPPEPVYSCWNPFFPWRSELTAMALEVGAMSYDPKQSCLRKDVLSTTDVAKAHQYKEASITSESEFVITNGRAKILQLPAGEYTYSIKPHLSLFDSSRPAPASVIATGQLSWDQKTRRSIINSVSLDK